MPWMAELEENKRAAALAAGEDPKTPSSGTPADTQPNTPIPGMCTECTVAMCSKYANKVIVTFTYLFLVVFL